MTFYISSFLPTRLSLIENLNTTLPIFSLILETLLDLFGLGMKLSLLIIMTIQSLTNLIIFIFFDFMKLIQYS